MGRMWNALRRDPSTMHERTASCTTPVEDAGPVLTESEEVPFIEVGPRKSIEASPSVLAYERKKDHESRKKQNAPASVAEAPLLPSVPFRAVFLVAPETEGEALQTGALAHLLPPSGKHLTGCIVAADR
jgi:hypothetical protein